MQQPAKFTSLSLALFLLASSNVTVHANPLTLAAEPFTEDAVTAIYDPTTGNLSVRSDIEVTSFQVVSNNSLLIPDAVKPGVLESPFDVLTESKWFILALDGFTEVDVGPIYPPGMDPDAIVADLSVEGSLAGGGSLNRELGSSPHLFVVPEPSSLALLAMVAVTLLAGVRRKRSSS